MSEIRPTAVIVLAAGEGTRMRSSTPKVLHRVAGRSLVGHVLAACAPLSAEQTVVVVGHGRDRVVAELSQDYPQTQTVEQIEQLGTGHAVGIALTALEQAQGTVLVVCGDTPLLSTATLNALLSQHRLVGAAGTVLSAQLADPYGYGRVVRDLAGAVQGIVEETDATPAQREITEINAGIYAFELDALRPALSGLTRHNAQGEEYLTDVIDGLRAAGKPVAAVTVAESAEVLGVNDRVQLARVGALLRDRINEDWMRAGVTIDDPQTTWLDSDVTLTTDVVIHSHTALRGRCQVASGAEIGPGCWLTDTVVGPGAIVRETTADQATIGPQASVGPYTYLRPGTVLGDAARVGAFVEMKNSRVGDGSKVPHLSYVGDAEIGEGSNIGAATVFVNYDGVSKHRTVIGDHVRVGSDTMLVAPVEVGDGAYTAAGSVITDDVPPGAMGVGRARQRTIRGWVARKRAGSASAQAAEAAEQALAAGRVTEQPADNETSTGNNGRTAADDRHPSEGSPG